MKKKKCFAIYIPANLEIFNKPAIRKKVGKLMQMYESDICDKYHQVIAYLKEKYPKQIFISYKNFRHSFQKHFCANVLKKAIEQTLLCEGVYNIITNILSILTESEMEGAVNGEIIIETFADGLMTWGAVQDLYMKFLS